MFVYLTALNSIFSILYLLKFCWDELTRFEVHLNTVVLYGLFWQLFLILNTELYLGFFQNSSLRWENQRFKIILFNCGITAIYKIWQFTKLILAIFRLVPCLKRILLKYFYRKCKDYFATWLLIIDLIWKIQGFSS